MNRIHRYLFGPIGAVRPVLLAQGLLLLLGADVAAQFVQRGGLFAPGVMNVAHFAWLDQLQPLPTPELYAAMMLIVAVLALAMGLAGPTRSGVVVVLVLFTYGWMMSLFDAFQHHYLISLMLLCVVFFPQRRSAGRLAAPAYVTLGLLIAMVYFFTTVTKVDLLWLSGRTLRKVAIGLNSVFGDSDGLWAAAAIGVIFVELALTGSYLIAVTRDRAVTKWKRRVCIVGIVLVVVLHYGIESARLSIGWFSHYMFLAGFVFMLPRGELEAVWWLAQRVPRSVMTRIAGADRRWSNRWCVVGSAIVGASAVVIGATLDLPGALAGFSFAGALIVVWVLLDLRRHDARAATGRVIAGLLAVAVVWVVMTAGARGRFYASAARELAIWDRHDKSLAMYDKAMQYTRDRDELANLFGDRGEVLAVIGDARSAAASYRRALELDEDQSEAMTRLALLLVTADDAGASALAEAVKLGERAVELTKRKDPRALRSLAYAYSRARRSDDAARVAQEAITIATRRGDLALAHELQRGLKVAPRTSR